MSIAPINGIYISGGDAVDVRDLRALIGIAEAGSLSAAAKKLHLTQPALSSTLRRLEGELSLKLVQRHSRGVSLTEEGRMVVERAYGVVREMTEISAAAQNFSQEASGTVRIGLPTTVAGGLLPELMPQIRDRYPKIKVYALEAMTGVLNEQVQMGHLDLAVIYDSEPMAGLRSKPLIRERLDLLVPTNHPLASKQTVRLSEITQPLVLPSVKHSIRRFIEHSFQTEGLTPNVTADIDSLPGLINMVAGGFMTILPTFRCSTDIKQGRIKNIEIIRPHLEWTVHLASRYDSNRPRANLAIAQLLTETCHRMVKEGRWPGSLCL